MLYAFGFERIGVVASDLYFVDPDPIPGQEGAERGVRLEVRVLRPGELPGSIYASRPVVIDRPVWRADLLESAAGPSGSLDRAHHHPGFDGWEPGERVFADELSAAPLGWVAGRLADLDTLLAEAGVPASEAGPDDAADLRDAVPDIMAAVRRLLDGVAKGELARPPAGRAEEDITDARVSWL
ncbi:hypothetical protein I5Q34_16190 [Streptomyces sp. AV19]|uniref:hypothetical protein n=1 Tax=Streptomyces sp. AV19 TaxID=2793068 RepID=UPI0018FEA1AE|nr:hypothetical protein [Streptomyces sp. AV19]MBH1935792.1 hypothetical protein [Streptomyces sp. AV19]MDG4536094.1 hypothetical protein [Streptomyces sp. AV19]